MSESHTSPITGRRVLVNTGALAGSSIWRILISFVLQVLITRVLGVAQFGQYVSALAFLNVAQIASELGLPNLLVRDLAQNPTERRSYFQVALAIQLLSALATWAVLILLSFVLPLSPGLRVALRLAGASLPFYAVTSVCQTLFQAGERMELVMLVEGMINLLIAGLSIAVLFQGGQVEHLIGVMVITQAVSAVLCLYLTWRTHLLTGNGKLSINLAQLWREARPFYWLSLADVLLHRLDILLLNVVTGDYLTGLYSIAYSLVRVVVKLIQSYWKALYPTLSRLRHESARHYRRLADLSLRYGLMVVLPGAALTVGVAAPVLTLLYGVDAEASGATLQILVWMTPFFLLETYAITLLMADHAPGRSLFLTCLHIAAVILLLPWLTRGWGAPGAAAAMVVASAFGAAAGLGLLHRRGLPIHVSKLGFLLIATGVGGLLNYFLPGSWLVRTVISALAYLVIIGVTGVFAVSDRDLLRRTLRVAQRSPVVDV
ncbi:MAG: oligosaccharide flippase family protein [Caldilineaceae bacterium]|nr:oligosaccharide flippase family protein [Caldilineaceae bacterium]